MTDFFPNILVLPCLRHSTNAPLFVFYISTIDASSR